MTAAAPGRPREPRPGTWFRRRIDIRSSLREIWGARELVRSLAERDLRARYKQAFLGVAWAVVTPLVLMAVFTVVFDRVTKVDTQGVPYPLFAYVGLVPWTFFSSSVSTAGVSLVANTSLLNKIYCPREVFPLAAVIVAGVDTALSLFALVPLFVITGHGPTAQSVWVPLLFAIQLCFTLGVTLAVSSILVYLRDLRHALPIILQFGLFATPVAYGIGTIAESSRILFAAVNPLAPVIEGYRETVLYGRPPEWATTVAGSVTAIVVLAGGYVLFKRLETGIADVA